MNKLVLLCALMLLGSASAMENVKNCTDTQTAYVTSDVSQDMLALNFETGETIISKKSIVIVSDTVCKENADLDLNEIVFIEEEPQIELGFDTVEYLPEGFDPYKLYVDLKAVEYVDGQEEINLGFNAADYLPANFDPYADPSAIDGINYIEAEEQFELGFDTAEYLPKNFDPYASENGAIEVTVL